jgi:hypothetical protein
MLTGGAVLAWSLGRRRARRGRTALQALAGVALLGIGWRRRAERRADGIETGEDVGRTEEGEKRTSDEAYAETNRDLGAQRNADESASVYQSDVEPNPRGMSDRADLQRDEGGDVDFVEGKAPETRGTHLEAEGARDTRLHSEHEDERTEVDLSEAAMADEASEAAGPRPEQAYPAREGTDPEPISDEAPPRVGEVTDTTGSDAESRDDESRGERDDSPESTD